GLKPAEVAHLGHVSGRLHARLLELPEHRLGHALGGHGLEGEAHGHVAVPLLGPKAEHPAGTRLEHRHRRQRAVAVEHLGHPQLFREKALAGGGCWTHSLISMETPAGRLRRMSASAPRGFGSRMSTMRLWVRISNFSRESLSMNGERITVILL